MKELNLVRQTKMPNACGQCTVATITGKPIEEVIKLYGHNKKSNMKDAKNAIDRIGGFTYGSTVKVDNRKKWELPSFAFTRICMSGRNVGHFVAYKDGVFYDPLEGVFNSKEDLLNAYSKGGRKWRFTHYFEVSKVSDYAKASGN